MKKILSLLLVALMAMPGALAGETRPMGRYVESAIDLPRGVSPLKLTADEQGRPALLARNQEGLSAWVWEGSGWSNAANMPLPYDLFPNDVAQLGQHTYYLHYTDAAHALGYRDQQLVDLNLDFAGSAPGKLELSSKGLLIAQSREGSILVYDPQKSAPLWRFDGLGDAIALWGDWLFALSRASGSVLQYDLGTGQLLYEMKGAPVTGGDLLCCDGQSLFLANGGGIYRITPGGSIWEQLVAGNLTSLCLPSVTLADDVLHTGMVVDGGNIYILADRDESFILLAYHIDPAIATLPQYQLTVQTLRESQLLTQAAAVFQANNPDYLVDIQVLLAGDAGVLPEDAIRALNIQLLAGKGPDILLLDGMPMASYGEKGVLADLGAHLAQWDLLPSLVDPLSRDGTLYAVPTGCLLPAVMGDAQALERENALPWRTKEGYFSLLLPASYPAWFTRDGRLDQALIAQYLMFIDGIYARCGGDESRPGQKAYMAAVAAQGAPDLMGGKGGFLFDLPRLSDGRIALYPFALGELATARFQLSTLEKMGGTLAWLPGQAQNVYAPVGLLGVNARSAQPDAALAFVATALSMQVQGLHGNGALPVTRQALAALVEQDVDMSLGYALGDPETDETIVLAVSWPPRPIREQIAAMLRAAQTPYIPDQTLLHLIMTELTPYFEGTLDAQSAARGLCNKLTTYLAE